MDKLTNRLIPMIFRKFTCSIILLLGLTKTFAQPVNNEIDDLNRILKKARVATFYSATYSNGWDELQLAKSFTDSAELILSHFDASDSSVNNIRDVIRSLKEEHRVSESIAVDNVNYKYPTSSLMSGHREDFIIKDDAEELLVESLLEKVLSQNDPLNKGKISENIDYLVFQVQPYNQTLFLVASDFLATESGHYVIRHHEFAEILGEDGFRRFKNDQLEQADWNRIFDYYGIDKILNLKVVDQGSVIDGLFYKGIYINGVEKGSVPEYVGYFEGFKVDKISSWDNAVLVLSLNFVILLLGLFLMMAIKFSQKKGRGIKIGKYNAFLFINWETIKETSIIGVVSLITAIGIQHLGNQFAPDINAFYQDSSVRIWVLFQSFVPFLASALITYMVMFKLPNIIVNNSNGYARILFGSWMAQLVVLSYYEYHAELFSKSLWVYLDIVQGIGLLFLSTLLGSLLNKLFKKEKVTRLGYSLLALGFSFAFFSFWLELRELFLIANLAYSVLALVSIWMLYYPDMMGVKSIQMEANHLTSNSGLSNPLNWYTKGLNVLDIQNEVLAFLDSDDVSNRFFIIEGKSGSGKSRLLKQTVELLRDSSMSQGISWFQGDCNQVLEGTAPLYEPFYEAFILNGEQINYKLDKELRCLPNGFFSDRSQLSKAFGKVVSQASSVAPVDLANLLSVEDESSRSVDEIISELIDSLISKYIDEDHKKVVLVFDDFHWIDEATLDLLTRFYEKTKERSKFSKYFKFILVLSSDQDSTLQSPLLNLQTMLSQGQNSPTGEIVPVVLELTDSNLFVQEILAETEFQIQNSESSKFRFGPLLKHHLQHLISKPGTQFVPGDFLGYLEALQQKEYIRFDGEVIRLVKEPLEDEIGLQDSRRNVLESDFKGLQLEWRTLLESAAIVGYKFDAELLARIWERDLLTVLADLEYLEGSFVNDLSQEDNVYSFVSKTMYRVVLDSANRKNNEDESRQLIIEYQKRIIKNIIEDNDDDYVESLDLDILLSASERCFKYSHVKYINEHSAVIVLHAAKKLAIKGKREQSLNYLKRLFERHDNFSSRELVIIAQTLSELTKAERLTNDFEFTRKNESNVTFLDHVFNKARQNAEEGVDYDKDAFALIAIIQLGGVMQFIRNLSRKIPELSIQNAEALIDNTTEDYQFVPRLINRYQIVNGLLENNQIKNQKAQSRLTFYNHIASRGDYNSLPNLFKNALTVGYFGLAGEIGREIYFTSNYNEAKRLKYLFGSLELLAGNVVTIEQIEGYQVEKKSVEQSIDKIIKAKNLTSKEAQDFNFLLSRFREYFFKLKDYSYVIELSDIAMELSKRLNDSIGITLAHSYRGAALFQLKKYSESSITYEAYFEHVIRSSRKVDDFLYPLEGILRNCQILGDFSQFNRAKAELYEHLIILEKGAIDRVLQHSLFDRESTFSKLLIDLPEIEEDENFVEEDLDNIALDVVRILVSMATADGRLDENEKYDLKESVIAISHSLNLDKKEVVSNVTIELNAANNRNFEETEKVFLEACKNVLSKKSKDYLKSVIQLCSDLAMANNEIEVSEKKLLEKSRLLLSEEE